MSLLDEAPGATASGALADPTRQADLMTRNTTVDPARSLLERFQPGYRLTELDVQQLQSVLARRDQELMMRTAEVPPSSAASSHLSRLAQGINKLVCGDVNRNATGIKSAFLPFVAALPAGLREPLRWVWRSAHAGPRCALCGASNHHLRDIGVVAPTHPGPFVVNDYRLQYCTACDSVRLLPTPSAADLRTLYQDSVQFSDSTYTAPERVERMLAYYGGCIERHRLLPTGSCSSLEVGAGLAWVSRAGKQRHLELTTVAQDLSAECVDHCGWVDRYLVGELDTIPPSPTGAGYDLISLTHVIEHLPDPASALRALSRLLGPKGKVFLTAPHRPPGWQLDQGLAPWLQYSYLHVPAHISYLSQAWMRRVAEDCGLQLLHWDAEQDGKQAFEAVLGRPAAAAH